MTFVQFDISNQRQIEFSNTDHNGKWAFLILLLKQLSHIIGTNTSVIDTGFVFEGNILFFVFLIRVTLHCVGILVLGLRDILSFNTESLTPLFCSGDMFSSMLFFLTMFGCLNDTNYGIIIQDSDNNNFVYWEATVLAIWWNIVTRLSGPGTNSAIRPGSINKPHR